MAVKMTSVRLDTRLTDRAAKILGAKNRTEAVPTALREAVALKKLKKLMAKGLSMNKGYILLLFPSPAG
jgi:hypothetical protein